MDPDTITMHDILNKLRTVNPTIMEANFNAAAEDLIKTAKSDVELKVAMTSEVTESSVTVQNYRIDIVLNKFAGREKKFYNIVETNSNKIIHQELALFETAIGIVKKYMTGKSGISELEMFDTQYATALHEVWTQHYRAKNSINQDIALAKASAAKQRVQESKSKILKRL